MLRWSSVVTALVIVVSGCTSIAPTAVPRFPLKTEGAFVGCLGVALNDAQIKGSASDPRLVWLEGGGERVEVIWPPRYSARFVPKLEVLDERGRVVLRDGDMISGACAAGDSGQLYLSPPF